MLMENEEYFKNKLLERRMFEKNNFSDNIIEKASINFVLYNSYMLLKTIFSDETTTNFENNSYFQNLKLYISKQDFNYDYSMYEGKINIKIFWNKISKSIHLYNYEIILYTLKRLPKHLQDYINSDIEYLDKEYSSLLSLRKKSKENIDKLFATMNEPFIVDGITYKNQHVYTNFLLDLDPTNNFVIIDNVVCPKEDSNNKKI